MFFALYFILFFVFFFFFCFLFLFFFFFFFTCLFACCFVSVFVLVVLLLYNAQQSAHLARKQGGVNGTPIASTEMTNNQMFSSNANLSTEDTTGVQRTDAAPLPTGDSETRLPGGMLNLFA
jgi:hypothetical protein